MNLGSFYGLQGETAEEVTGLAKAMRARCIHVPTSGDVLDIVGTGGDGIGSVNISTGATVIAAAAGAKVAKHGNRSVSSLCGSADVLEVGWAEAGQAGPQEAMLQCFFVARQKQGMKGMIWTCPCVPWRKGV